ncbi:MAG: PP2C family protein-serine/threonine phosphatase [Deltaproteobacteria bacterium]|nr:PP2C family protein-serine/threonine phosphatase [Deltaproteobacteria bacterium]
MTTAATSERSERTQGHAGTGTAAEAAATNLDDYVAALTHSWLKTLTTLGFTLIPIFFILDVFMMPRELLTRFGVYRGVAVAIVVAQFFVVRATAPSRKSVLHGYLFTLVVGGTIALMTTDLGGFDSTYYAGLNLVLIAVNLLLPWEAIHSAINSAIIIVLYLVMNLLLLPDQTLSSSIVVNNLYFLCSTAVIAVSINYVKQNLVKQEFFLRADLKAARDALWGEMEVAKHIQTALLPRVHQLPGYSVAATMLPADVVGGDYYDIMTTRHGETWLAIGDVSGHGVESGLIMMMTQTSLDTAINQEPKLPPSRALGRVNDTIRRNISRLGADRYMTITALRVDGVDVTFAGKHQDLLVYRSARGATEVVPTQGTWIGLVDDLEPHLKDQTLTLAKDDVLLLFTDGITEAMSAGGEMFGEDRLRQALTRYAAQPVEQLVESIMREVRDHAAARTDDLTVIALKRLQ